jgi:hypothetical protein
MSFLALVSTVVNVSGHAIKYVEDECLTFSQYKITQKYGLTLGGLFLEFLEVWCER